MIGRLPHETLFVRAECVRRCHLGSRPVRRSPLAGPASFKRLVQLVADITANPQHSLPKACDDWADLKAAYRFLSNARVTPDAIQAPHRTLTRSRCADHPTVLIAQDFTDLDFTSRKKTKGLGRIGDGIGRGLLQHTALAVTPQGKVIGVLHQQWMIRPERPADESRRERLARRRMTDAWSDAVKTIDTAPDGTRFVHVTDREGDSFQLMQACAEHDAGFLIRARHDRCVKDGTDKLWTFMADQPVRGRRTIDVSAGPKRRARRAKLELRFAQVVLEAPKHDPRFKAPRTVWAVYVAEPHPPKDVEPIDWLLLTSEAVKTVAEGWERVEWYRCRWLIEEFHKAEKSGCRLEASQLDDGADIQRLAAIVAVTAVRLLMLRGLVDDSGAASAAGSPQSRKRQATMLQRAVPWLWIVVVARADKKNPADPQTLTPREFWLRVARRGGYIGRRQDGRPGWSTIWKGWYDFTLMFQGAELMTSHPRPKCG